MAVGPSEARIPCPQCGGLVHPIAGRCRHCKFDLSANRGTRPAAAAPLPALDQTAPHPVMAAPIAIAQEASQPVLPPRPTGSMPKEAAPSLWRSWPMVVIGLATIAIVAAVVIMVWPASHVANAKRTLQPPPAPERMDTNSLTPTPTPPPHASNIPMPPSRHTPDPLTPTPNDPDDLMNPFGGTTGGGMRGLGAMNGLANLNAGLMKAVLQHGCDRLAACGTKDDVLRMTCQVGLDAIKNAPPPPTCAAAERCIKRIDELDCKTHMTGLTDLLTLLPDAQDCLAALSC